MNLVNKKLTVVMLTNLFPPVSTGSSVQSSSLARELVKQGHRVLVFTSHIRRETPDFEIQSDGVEVYRFPCLHLPRLPISMNFEWLNSIFRPSNLRKMARILKEQRVQVIHIHNHMFDSALAGIWLGRKLKIPTAVTIHTVIQHTKTLYNLILHPIDKFFLGNSVIKKADVIINPDCTVEKYIEERFKRKDGRIIPYGISFPNFPSQELIKEIKDKWDLNNKKVILSLGHLHALRNRIELIKAFSAIAEKHSDAIVVIVGSRGYPQTEELVKKLNLEDRVIFTGALPHNYAAAFHQIAYCEANWLDQKNMASAGVSCLEAMYYGKAVITACPEDTHEVGGLKNRENVVILPRPTKSEDVAPSLDFLLSNPDSVASIGREASKFVQHYFAWDEVTNKHVALYDELCCR